MMIRHLAIGAVVLASVALPALAQNELPAVSVDPAAQAPASPAASAPAAAAATSSKPDAGKPAVDTSSDGGGIGTTIVGERESPIGLYITPWREAGAEKDIDRPARLLQEKLLPIDKAVFQREIDYYDALSAELKRKGLITPAAH